MSTERSPRLRAVRGAITVDADDPATIVAATERLLAEVLQSNHVAPEDLVSIVFTSTPDLTAEFPAAAARRLALDGVPLLCASEIDVPGALPRCIRVLAHLYSPRARDELVHPYLGGARVLRDRAGGISEPELEA
ncbi:MAG: chorismate mutase [Actinomycetota bacterium]|nr:chorismate mutase [Actinomycetota bacterium]